MLDATQRLDALQPCETDWQNQLGVAHNNLEKMALLGGDLRGAIAGYRADVDIEAKAVARDPRNNAQRERLLVARAALGRTLAHAGDLDGAATLLRQALKDAQELLAIESKNSGFQEDAGLYSLQLARVQRLRGETADAAALAAQAQSVFAGLVAADASQKAWQRENAEAMTELATQAAASDRGSASQALREALAILDPQFAGNPQDRATVLATVDARLRLATLSTADEQETLARSGLAAIEAQTSGRTDPRLQALHVESLLLLQRGTEARTLGETLVASGYRDAGFMALLRTHDIASKR
jgi:ribosomal protein S18 acetylase RimI-like enzyme